MFGNPWIIHRGGAAPQQDVGQPPPEYPDDVMAVLEDAEYRLLAAEFRDGGNLPTNFWHAFDGDLDAEQEEVVRELVNEGLLFVVRPTGQIDLTGKSRIMLARWRAKKAGDGDE